MPLSGHTLLQLSTGAIRYGENVTIVTLHTEDSDPVVRENVIRTRIFVARTAIGSVATKMCTGHRENSRIL